MRPIFSASATYNYELAKWLEIKLQPLPYNEFTVHDALDFAREITKAKIKQGDVLVSYSVSSLFTSIPLDETIELLADKAFCNNWFNLSYDLKISKNDLIELLTIATKEQLFQFDGQLDEQIDGVAMGSPLGPLLANFFMCNIEDILQVNENDARQFLQDLNQIHPSLKLTMELENNGVLPFLGIQLINKSPNIKTKVYVKPTSTGLLLHYESHVDARYKSSLIATLLQRAWRISSSWQHFTDECERLEIMLCKLKYPQHMVKATIRRFTNTRITAQQLPQSTNDENLVRVVLPFKDQRSADIVRNRLKDLSRKTSVTIQPVFVNQKINDLLILKIREKKPSIVNQQRVVYKFKCDLCDTG